MYVDSCSTVDVSDGESVDREDEDDDCGNVAIRCVLRVVVAIRVLSESCLCCD